MGGGGGEERKKEKASVASMGTIKRFFFFFRFSYSYIVTRNSPHKKYYLDFVVFDVDSIKNPYSVLVG